MADSVSSIVIADTATHHIIHLTNVSDGTGEAAVIKVDKSAIAVAADGAEADSLDIEQVRWAVQGFTSVRLLWDHAADDTALVLSGNGYEDFRLDADSRGTLTAIPSLKDPRTAGGTGDILLTTAGASAGATYDVTLFLRKATS